MTKRRPLWPAVTVALVLLPVLYVLSCGPARLIAFSDSCPAWLYDACWQYIRPLGFLHDHGPQWLSDLLDAYAEFWYRQIGQ